MAISEKKKATNARWDKDNMATVGCKLRKEQAESFRAYAQSQGKTSNALLKEYILTCIEKSKQEEMI